MATANSLLAFFNCFVIIFLMLQTFFMKME